MFGFDEIFKQILKYIFPKIYKNIRQYKVVKYLYSIDEVNEKMLEMNFSAFETTRWLNGRLLSSLYWDFMYEVKVFNGENYSTIKIPYVQLVDFIQNPNADIFIEGNLTISGNFKMTDDLIKATDKTLSEVIKAKNPYNCPHPRIATFGKNSDNQYCCSIELASYFQLIRTNLNMDSRIYYKGRMTTMRTLEVETMRGGLADFEQSNLANIIGVSAIWLMKSGDDYRVFLLPRKQSVSVYESNFGTVSGYVESPKDNTFKNNSLVDYLKLEIAREFAEETGIADNSIDLTQYNGKEIESDKISYKTKLEIIPLAFLREMLRGGMPQMFFLIRTENIPDSILVNCVSKSLGIEEFDNSLFTKAKISTEVACNYLYAMKYLQKRSDGNVDLSYYK